MNNKDIVIEPNKVIILGKSEIPRPDSVAPSQWLHFWEMVAKAEAIVKTW